MLIIKNAQISTGHSNDTRKADIYIDGEKFSKIKDAGSRLPKNADVIDAGGLLAIPGAIDPHVHLFTPGMEEFENFEHGTKAAARGGVTTVIDMPELCLPHVTNKKNLEEKLATVKKQAHVDFALWGGVSKNSMKDEWWHDSMSELLEAGVTSFKTYLISNMDTFQDLSIIELGQVMQHAKKIGALVGLHAEEKDLIETRTEELKKEGKNSLFDYYFSRSDPAEKEGVAIGLHLAKQTGCSLHIVHVGSRAALEVIKRAKELGVDVTAETCPHFLEFTYKDFEKYGSLIKTMPVVKTAEDRDALWQGLADGSIDFVSTDHAPCPIEKKQTGSCWTDFGGVPGLQFIFPYLFSEGFKKKRLTLARLIEVTSKAQAKRFGLYPKKGALKAGSDADLILIDPKKSLKIKKEDLESKAKWTPLEGREFKGQITKTILRGKTIYDRDRGVVCKAGYGGWVRRDK